MAKLATFFLLLIFSLGSLAEDQKSPQKEGAIVTPLGGAKLAKALKEARRANLYPGGTPGNICYIGPCDGGSRTECVYDDKGECTQCSEIASPVCSRRASMNQVYCPGSRECSANCRKMVNSILCDRICMSTNQPLGTCWQSLGQCPLPCPSAADKNRQQ